MTQLTPYEQAIVIITRLAQSKRDHLNGDVVYTISSELESRINAFLVETGDFEPGVVR